MKIAKNAYVSLAYRLRVNGNVVEDVKADAPLDFIFGIGMLLPKFEENVENKEVGDSFAFTITPEEGYGAYLEEYVTDLPKSIFEVEGVFNEEQVSVDAILPMMDNQGNQMAGKVLEITEEIVKIDFNHPMAGSTLDFEGEIVAVREATDEDMAKFMPQGDGCSCGCEESNGCDSDCGSKGSCCE